MKKPYIVETTVEEWINEEAFPPYFANRDVNRRMKKAHLQGAITSPEQAVVRAVDMGDKLIKIDGHSRAEAWRRNQLDRPDVLTVMVFPASDEEEMAALYKSFNSKEAAEPQLSKRTMPASFVTSSHPPSWLRVPGRLPMVSLGLLIK